MDTDCLYARIIINIIHIHLNFIIHVKLRSASGSGIFSCRVKFDILFISEPIKSVFECINR